MNKTITKTVYRVTDSMCSFRESYKTLRAARESAKTDWRFKSVAGELGAPVIEKITTITTRVK